MGEPRQLENPYIRTEDISGVIDYLCSIWLRGRFLLKARRFRRSWRTAVNESLPICFRFSQKSSPSNLRLVNFFLLTAALWYGFGPVTPLMQHVLPSTLTHSLGARHSDSLRSHGSLNDTPSRNGIQRAGRYSELTIDNLPRNMIISTSFQAANLCFWSLNAEDKACPEEFRSVYAHQSDVCS
jgi:hypothetical protein